MSKENTVIVDYGMGNLFSIAQAIKFVGGEPEITDAASKISGAQRLVLPGVGAFGEGMRVLSEKSLLGPIFDFVKSGKPILGICLGMQLLLTESHEFGLYKGLNLIKGKVVRFKEPSQTENQFKIPHIGWNSILFSDKNKKIDGTGIDGNKTIFEGINSGSYFYFVHSFFASPDDPNDVWAESEYGRDRFCSVLHRDNIWGCQFHPERSSEEGLKILRNFVHYIR